MHRSEVYRFEELAKGVWAAMPHPGSGALANSGIIDLGRASLVFDTSQTPRAAKELRAAARILTGKEPLEVVNSHWHFDHTLGNRVFGGCTIRGTRRTHDLLLERGAPIPSAVHDPNWSRATASLEARARSETDPLARLELEEEACARRDLSASLDLLEVRPPDETFEGRYIYPGGSDVMIVEGAGHSESDTILFVPGPEIMFAGGLLSCRTHPGVQSADLNRWILALERMEKGSPKAIVPGHGPVAGVEGCGELVTYLQHLQAVAREPTRVTMPEEYASWARPSRYAANLATLRAARR